MKRFISISVLIGFFAILMGTTSCKENDTTPDPGSGNSQLHDTTLLNISYGTDPAQVYDVYLPAQRDSGTPVILMIHGGAWKAGKKEELNGYLNIIKSKWSDVALVNMNYRLASNANNIHHDEIIADIEAVVDHVRSNMSDYHISDRMGVMGASAGGQLSMIYAYRYNSDIKCIGNFFGPANLNDWAWYNSNNIWLGGYTGDILAEYVGQTWDTTAYKAVSPFWNIDSSSQPTISFHGNLDPIVPVYQTKYLHGKLNNLGVDNEYHEYIAFHGFDNTQSNDALGKMVVFFKKYLE